MDKIDLYACRSRLSHWNGTGKLIFAMGSLFLCLWVSHPVLSIAMMIGNGVYITCFGRTPLLAFLKGMRIPVIFLVISTLTILFQLNSRPLDGYAIPFGMVYLTSSKKQLWFGINLMVTALGCVSCLYALSFTTRITDILLTLKKLRFPALLIELMLLIYRFIFLLSGIATAITLAQDARLGNRNLKTKTKSFGGLGSALFIQSMKRSFKLYDAMESRCYDGQLRVLEEDRPLKKDQVIFYVTYALLYASLLCVLILLI